MHALANGAIGFDLERPNRGQAHFKHISDSCYLETLADRAMVTIKVE